jgi:hypothetical protein
VHSGAAVQVLMDLWGVLVSCIICTLLLSHDPTVVGGHVTKHTISARAQGGVGGGGKRRLLDGRGGGSGGGFEKRGGGGGDIVTTFSAAEVEAIVAEALSLALPVVPAGGEIEGYGGGRDVTVHGAVTDVEEGGEREREKARILDLVLRRI